MSHLRSSLLGLTCVLGLLLGSGSTALACKCMFPSVEQAKESAAAIFEGRVTAIEDVPANVEGGIGDKRVTLSLVRVWKGLQNEETVQVRTSASSASCGYTFEQGTSYLVYASQSERGLEVSGCSRTRTMSDAGEDLAGLGGGVTPVKVEPKPASATPEKAEEKPAPQAAPKSGGCASTKGQASASLWLMTAPVFGLVLRRKKPRA